MVIYFESFVFCVCVLVGEKVSFEKVLNFESFNFFLIKCFLKTFFFNTI